MIVIPMAGLSRRFVEAGYTQPKFMLPLGERTAFDLSVLSFERYFADRPFLFIARESGGVEAFIETHCAMLGVRDVRVALLDQPTAGQAETVEQGIDRAAVDGSTPLTIFNIDTFRAGYREPDTARLAMLDGYLEVFRGEGANWSYVRPAPEGERIAAETAEKRPISDLCCTGLYHFARAADFRRALDAERTAPQSHELYVAPLYNHLIGGGATIGYECIEPDEVVFCGTPAEYEALLARPD
ncbi:glycosyltransferase family protein [Sphingomonas baiyangensis]|uniref:Capsular biosynthesis protein n=1 Tax=Sphingomonas baiyangensis TaxID=2572576 RepID=A0A4V5PUH8_9SPHN|nr:capsular biosynthesis protein [Sphingomonas baiyangensis]TKD50318.1 capsular biosynthesis protein [Sphingomonas baiyangensis]